MTVYWMVWDAAAHWIVNRMVIEGQLPATTRLRASGLRAAARPPAPNCQTPPSLATMFTGEWPQRHGVTGFRLARPDGAVDATSSGFATGSCAVPTVWELAARHGLRTVSVHAPWIFNRDGHALEGVDAGIEAYGRRMARHGGHVIDQVRTVGIGPFTLRVEPCDGAVRVEHPAGRLALRPADAWRQLPLAPGIGVWLRAAPVDGELLLLHTGAWQARVDGRDTALVQELRRLPVFAGEGLGSLYRAGRLGRRLAEGGDGSAEDLFLSSVECVSRGFSAAVDAVLAHHRADLVVVYLPTTDDVGHELVGWCDGDAACYRSDVAEAAWKYLTRCYRTADSLLERVLNHAHRQDTVVLAADHGIAGSTWQVFPNAVLVEAGLAVAADGRLDPERSAVLYHPANDGSVVVNHCGRKSGWVAYSRIPGLLEQAELALRGIVEPFSGRAAVVDFRRATDSRDSAVVHFAQDFQPSAGIPNDGRAVTTARKTGAHVTNTGDARLHAVLAAAGPGLTPGLDLGTVDNTFPARLVLQQLGLCHPSAVKDESGAMPCFPT